MYRRLIAIALLLIAVLQGPVLSYAATIESVGESVSRPCGGHMLAEKHCDTCCTHGSIPSCTAQCPVPVGAAAPLTLPSLIRIPLRGAAIPEAGAAAFAQFDAPRPLRPPIA